MTTKIENILFISSKKENLYTKLEDLNFFLLANPMCKILHLLIYLRIPVNVIQNDNTCSGEANAQTSRSNG